MMTRSSWFRSVSCYRTFLLLLCSRIHRTWGAVPNRQYDRAVFRTPSTLLVPNDRYHDSDVVIIGGGLAGLALLVGLGRKNKSALSVTLIERRPTYDARAGATLGLAANGVKALTELCGGDDVGIDFVRSIQRRGIDMQPAEDIPVHILPWWILRDALLEQANDLVVAKESSSSSSSSGADASETTSRTTADKIAMWNGFCLNRLVETTDGVRLHFDNSDVVVRAKLVVAADGVHSTVRSLMGLPPAVDSGMTVFRGNLVVGDDTEDEQDGADDDESNDDPPRLSSLLTQGYSPQLVRDGLTYFSIFNHNEKIPGLLLWVLGTPLPVHGESIDELMQLFSDVDDPRSLHLMKQVLMRTKNILKTKLSTIDMDHISSSDDVVQGWGGTKRVTFIGDAAHACRPTDGQGGNQALEDAVVLTRLLAADDDDDDLDDLLVKNDLVLMFENARRPRVKTIHEDQARRATLQGDRWTRWSPEFMDWVYRGV